MAEQSKNEVKFNSNLGGMLTIISPSHSEQDIKPEMDSDEQKLADLEDEGIIQAIANLSVF